ncbi:hypothetical protein GCM10010498_48050 [Streptomyces cavourensis]|nr:hypothetical protein GCM10010498_48050 [Streptomyces cavourensis]
MPETSTVGPEGEHPAVDRLVAVAGQGQHAVVERFADRQVGVCAMGVRGGARAGVTAHEPDGEARTGIQGVRGLQVEAERVARRPVQVVGKGDGVRFLPDRPPGRPPDESVDRTVQLRFGDVELVLRPVEGVAAVVDPVGPGNQQVAEGRRGRFVGAVREQERFAPVVQLPQARARLGDGRRVVAGR